MTTRRFRSLYVALIGIYLFTSFAPVWAIEPAPVPVENAAGEAAPAVDTSANTAPSEEVSTVTPTTSEPTVEPEEKAALPIETSTVEKIEDVVVPPSPVVSYAELMRHIASAKNGSAADKTAALAELSAFTSATEKDMSLDSNRKNRLVAFLELQRQVLGEKKELSFVDKAVNGLRSLVGMEAPEFQQLTTAEAPEVQTPNTPATFHFVDEPVTVQTIGDIVAPQPVAPSVWKSVWGIPASAATSAPQLPTIDDIGASDEVVITTDMRDLVASLGNNPTNIVNYLRQTIQYEPYFGAKKGSVGCWREKVCNDVDASSLTIALFRAAGIPARYHKSLMVMPATTWQNLLGVDETKTVYAALTYGKVPVYTLSNANDGKGLNDADFTLEKSLAAEWVYPEVFVSYDERAGNYVNVMNLSGITTTVALQTALVTDPTRQWIPTDVVVKPYTRTKGTIVADVAQFDAKSFWNNYLSYQGNLSPLDKYADDLKSQTQKDITKPANQSVKSIAAGKLAVLPPTLPYATALGQVGNIVIQPEVWSALPNNMRQQVTISLIRDDNKAEVFKHTFYGNEINNIPLTLRYVGATPNDDQIIEQNGGIAYTPAALVDITPVITTDGATYTTQSHVAIGDTLILQFDFAVAGKTISTDQKFSTAGNEEGVYVALSKVWEDPAVQTTADIMSRGTPEIARQYLLHQQKNNALLKASLDYEFQLPFARAVVTQNRVLNRVNGMPTTFDFQGLTTDVAVDINDYSNRGAHTSHRSDFRLLMGLDASYYEAQLFGDLAGLTGISTVRGLQYAAANPGVYTLYTVASTTPNYEALVNGFTLPTTTRQGIIADLKKGNTVVTPNKQISNGVFTGVIYISLAPDATGNYAIGQQVQNGGFTTDQFLQYAYVDMSAAQRDGYYKKLNAQRYYYEDTSYGGVNCSITDVDYNAVLAAKDWNAGYGHPCAINNIKFGTINHSYIYASNGNYFYSPEMQYGYWVDLKTIQNKMSQYELNVPNIAAIYTFKFSTTLGTYIQTICTKMGWINCDNNNYETVYYSPGQQNGHVYRVKAGFLSKVQANDNALIKLIGLPMSDEITAVSPVGTQGTYQKFFNGQLYYYKKWLLPWIYYNYGELTKAHNNAGGVEGDLGFPDNDPTIKNGYAYQQFENDKEIGWNLQNGQTSVQSYKKYRCELYPKDLDPVTAMAILSHGILDTGVKTVDDLGSLVMPIIHGVTHPAETWAATNELFDEVKKINVTSAKNFLKDAGGAAYAALSEEYDTSIGPNGCDARTDYLLGRISGEVLLLLIPASKLKAAAKIKIFTRLELAFPELNLISRSGEFGRLLNVRKIEDINELTRIKAIADSNLKGEAGEQFWQRFVSGKRRTFPIDDPNLGSRIVDVWDDVGGVAYEVKNYSSKVSATADILNQIDKDVYLMNTVKNYRPVWVFVDQGPTKPLVDYFTARGIEYILLTQ